MNQKNKKRVAIFALLVANVLSLNALDFVFKIEPTNGVIEKGKEQLIAVTFCSDKQDKYSFQFNLDVEDNLGYGVKLDPKPIKLNAEAFEVSVDLVIDNNEKIIDFGNVKVKEPKSFPFLLKNKGIYKIRYKFEIMKKLWQELFKFEPNEGVINPHSKIDITYKIVYFFFLSLLFDVKDIEFV